MQTFYSLSNCNTCKRIQSKLNLPQNVKIVNIKEAPLTSEILEHMKNLAGSYEDLFSKRAQLYKKLKLKEKKLSEDDYKSLLLKSYTFLKRPVLIYDEHIFIGNNKSIVEAAKKFLDEK